MTLDNLMNMATADRYTEDGRQQIEDARRTYKPGEISEKTGLQKQNDGTWAPPKAGAAERVKAKIDSAGSTTTPEVKVERGFHNSGVREIKLGNDMLLAFAPKEEGDMSGWSIYSGGEVLAGTDTWENSTPEEIEKDISKLGKALKENGVSNAENVMNAVKKELKTQTSSPSRPSPRPKSPAVKKPDVLNMTRSGAKKRIEAAGGKFIGNEGGKVWFETSDGGLYYFVMNKDNGRVASSSSISAPHNEADKAEIDKIKQKIAGAQEEQEAWAAMNGHKSYEDMLKAEDEAGEFYDRWRRGEIDEHGNELNKSTAAKEPDLSKVGHFNLNTARNQMNTTRAEDKWLDNFVTEMHEDGTSLDEIIKRQDEVFAKSKGRYPEEEKTYKSLREKIMKHYGGTSDSACDEQLYTPESINGPRENLERQLTGDTRIRVKK